jgi:hypothetical protein
MWRRRPETLGPHRLVAIIDPASTPLQRAAVKIGHGRYAVALGSEPIIWAANI